MNILYKIGATLVYLIGVPFLLLWGIIQYSGIILLGFCKGLEEIWNQK